MTDAQLVAAQPREPQQIVDELREPLGRSVHAPEHPCTVRAQVVAILLEHDPGEAGDRTDRCSEIVRHRVTECLELAVCRFELLRALQHALLERAVELCERMRGLDLHRHVRERDDRDPLIVVSLQRGPVVAQRAARSGREVSHPQLEPGDPFTPTEHRARPGILVDRRVVE